MELRQLFTFIAVVKVGGFTRAANLLGYAQSSVTAQIQALEAELETPLFDRLGKKNILTDAGQRLLPYAQEITKMHNLALDAMRSDTAISGTLTIGAPESLAAFRLPEIIREYKNRYPDVKIILKPGVCWELHDLIRSGELDLAFLLQPETEDRDLYIETLVHEKMALVSPPGHPLVPYEYVEPTHLKDETILHTEPGCTYRTLFEQHLNSHGIFPNPDLEFWSIEAIKNCVMSGLGLSFLPLITVQNEVREGKLMLLAWDDRQQRLATQIAYHRKKWISPALREFLLIVGKYAVEWRQSYISR
ncbi:LysR family transcriptional regulator [Desulfosporosinus sp. BICA1-9]|uniref:LysR family transcriptional regulator n=1 Tax=Desulfosporosinus sp. BICA1-9 TaxID=1531958 RepID=UPI00054B5A16|nr:LysR family transcriptional regulator [Desulfosporosinus sp. BICA1-9]KJS48339.1 MAG: transcriptional regulator [Peptococcaceae bacterium BRH_c23]KJS85797.1 MAG: transcriptional regulator [Desulfosporosinus sp. BICA1-9]HBW34965.1 LysR family transcriptional regulator [Desulfosporosinus sp.]